MRIQLSNYFTYGKLIRFTLPSIAMTIFTSIYLVVDVFFVSKLLAVPISKIFVGYNKTLFALTVSGFRIFEMIDLPL